MPGKGDIYLKFHKIQISIQILRIFHYWGFAQGQLFLLRLKSGRLQPVYSEGYSFFQSERQALLSRNIHAVRSCVRCTEENSSERETKGTLFSRGSLRCPIPFTIFIGITSPETSWISLCWTSFTAICEGGSVRVHDPPQFLLLTDLKIHVKHVS